MGLDGERQGQGLFVERCDGERGERPEGKADHDAEACEHHRLDHVDVEDEPAGGTEAFERGDDVALLRHVALDRVADADAAEQQGRQPDEIDELGEALRVAPERGGRIGPVADRKPALGKRRLHGFARLFEVLPVRARIVRQFHPVDPTDETAGLHEARLVQRLSRHQDFRPVGQAVGQPVGLLAQRAADRGGGLADLQRIADFEPQALEQDGLHQYGALFAPGGTQTLGCNHVDLSVERIDRIHGLDLDERALAVLAPRHGTEACGPGHFAEVA